MQTASTEQELCNSRCSEEDHTQVLALITRLSETQSLALPLFTEDRTGTHTCSANQRDSVQVSECRSASSVRRRLRRGCQHTSLSGFQPTQICFSKTNSQSAASTSCRPVSLALVAA